MIITVRAVRSGALLGQVKLDERGKPVDGDMFEQKLVTDVLRRVGGDPAALDGWTNGYVKLAARA